MAAAAGGGNEERNLVDCAVLEFQCNHESKGMLSTGIVKFEWLVLVREPVLSEPDPDVVEEWKTPIKKRIVLEIENKSNRPGVRLEEIEFDPSGAERPPKLLWPEKDKAKAPIEDSDFVQLWDFVGAAKTGDGDGTLYEAKQPERMDTWWPASIKEMTADGKCKVVLTMPQGVDQGADLSLEEFYTRLHYEQIQTRTMEYDNFGEINDDGSYRDIRWRDNMGHLKLPFRSMRMLIPMHDAVRGTRLAFVSDPTSSSNEPASSSLALNFLQRPDPQKDAKTVGTPCVVVEQDRSKATVPGWSVQSFTTWSENRVTHVAATAERRLAEWTFRVGHDEHRLRIERKKGKNVTVTADGSLLLDACPEDIALALGESAANAKDKKSVNFGYTLKKELKLAWKIWPVDKDGGAIEDCKEPMDQTTAYELRTELKVQIDDFDELSRCKILFVQNGGEGKLYQELEHWREMEPSTEDFFCPPVGLQRYCENLPGFRIPWVSDDAAAIGMNKLKGQALNKARALSSQIRNMKAKAQQNAEDGGFFSWMMCFCKPDADTVSPQAELVLPVAP